MRRNCLRTRTGTPSAPPSGPFPVAKVGGWNAAFAMNNIGATNSNARILDLKGSGQITLRFPGGTLANYAHPQDPKGYGIRSGEIAGAPTSISDQLTKDAAASGPYMPLMVSTAQAVGAKVMWVANIYTGTIAEDVYAIGQFIAAGVEVIGVELGNEWYLGRYASTYPTHDEYIAAAFARREGIRASYPTMPCGIVIGPSAAMKDVESGTGNQPKIDAGNTAINALTWPDAVVLHSYVGIDPAVTPYGSSPAAQTCIDHRAALDAHVNSFTRDTWLTEWNIFSSGAGDTPLQSEHYEGMIALVAANPKITVHHCHNLIAFNAGYNAINVSGGTATLNRIGSTAAVISGGIAAPVGPTLVDRKWAGGTPSGTVTVDMPAGNIGDLLVLAVGADATILAPSGWTTEYQQVYGGDGQTLNVFTRFATGGEGAQVTCSASGSAEWSAVCSRYRGVGSIEAKQIYTNATGGATPVTYTHPGITTTANVRVIVIAGEDHGVGATLDLIEAPDGYGHVREGVPTTYANVMVCDALKPSAGATGALDTQAWMTTGSSAGGGMVAMSLAGAAPPTSGIDPNDVTIVANSDDASSAAMATAYATAWGIPSGNIITVACGGTLSVPECTDAQGTTLYNAINTAGRQYTVLAMRYPSRRIAPGGDSTGQSITSVATFGVKAVGGTTTSPLYNYSGFKPYTDTGKRPAVILLDSAYRKDGVVLNSGTSYMVLANDTDRTPARSSQQTTPGIVALNSTSAGAGPGASYCNQLSKDCWISGFMDSLNPVNMCFDSVHHIVSDSDTVVWLNGFYGDSVSSWWGYLPTPLDSQTPITYFLDRGASMSVGSVSEPWQSGGSAPGSLKEQFVDISIFRPLFVANKPVGVACWASVKWPDRMLFAGDLMFTPQF